MLSDEERQAIEDLKDMIEKSKDLMEEEFYKLATIHNIQAVVTVLNLIEKQQKEIEHWKAGMKIVEKDKNNHIERLEKEIEELKEDKYGLEEEVQIQAKQLIEIDGNYISKEESKQKEKQAWIEGTNVADKLCNKMWKDKIKAKIEELENYYRELYKQDNSPNEFLIGQDCLSKLSILQEVKQSLLEKE